MIIDILSSTNGLILFLLALFHLIYIFFSGSKSVMRYIDIVALLFGLALWQYPEKIHAIIRIIMQSSSQ